MHLYQRLNTETAADRDFLLAKAEEIEALARRLQAMSEGLRHAAACPAPPPDMEGEYHCAKYDHMRDNYMKPPPPPADAIAAIGRAMAPISSA